MGNSLLIGRIDTLIRFFLYVLIFWIPYSPAVIESCVIICLILWLLKRSLILTGQNWSRHTLKEKLFKLLKGIKPESTFLNRPITFFILACILSVTSSAFFAQSLHNFFTKTLEWFIVYFLIIEVFKDKKHIYTAFAIFMFTAFSTVMDSLVQFHITYKDIFSGHMIEPGSRATAGFKVSNGLGGYLTGFIPIVLAWVFLGKQKFFYRAIALFILFFSLWSLIITFSRGAWVGVFFGGMFLWFFTLFSKKRLRFYFSLGLLLTTIVLCISFFLIFVNSSGRELFERYQTIPWRLSLWDVSVGAVRDKVFFGHGINTFMKIFQAYRGNLFMNPTYAHNCYIQMAVETGVVGLFCFFWIIVEMVHQSLGKIRLHFDQDRNLSVLTIGLLSGIIAFLVHSFFDTHFYSLQLSVYLWLMVGMLVAICKVFDMPMVRGR